MRRVLVLIVAIALLGLPGLSGVGPAEADPEFLETGFIPVGTHNDDPLDDALLHYKIIPPDPGICGPIPDGGMPTVIDYSGYLPAITIYDGLDDRFTDECYAVVGLNMRGTSCSSGQFDYFEPRQSIDGVEAIDWLADRPWSNGEFGMVGKSYPGISQLFVAGASSDHPDEQQMIDHVMDDHLKAIVPGHVFADLYRDVPWPGGILNVTFAAGWSLQRNFEAYAVGPMYFLQVEDGETDGDVPDEVREQCLENQASHAPNIAFNPIIQGSAHHFDDEFYRTRSPWYFADNIRVPTFLIESWQDEQVGSRATHLLERFRHDIPVRFLGTNGDHGEYYGPDVFPQIVRFLSFYLKHEVPEGDPCDSFTCYEDEDPVLVNWETGALGGRNSAFSTSHGQWPPPEQQVSSFAMTPDGRLEPGEASGPSGPLALLDDSQDYTYLPEVGSQQRGGFDLAGEPPAQWSDAPPEGTYAKWTSQPLDKDHVVLGPASVDLRIWSSAPDVDLEVTVSEVRPDGQEVFVQQGWLRASHRALDDELSTEVRPYQTHQVEDVEPLNPAGVNDLRVEVFPFGHVFREDSRLRVVVAAPHTHPDLWGFAALPTPAQVRVFESELVLPRIPGEAPTGFPECGTVRNQPCRDDPWAATE